jgi:hypothetical protein
MSSTHDSVYGCELWTGRRDRDGYGRIGRKMAHRVTWENAKGPIPEGMEIEHICRRRNCVALKHMELFTRSQQEKSKYWRNRIKRKCPNGCDMASTAMVTPEGGRLCRKCEGPNE